MITGYRCYLTISERSYIHKLIYMNIKRLTRQQKKNPKKRRKYTIRKSIIAKTYSKLEELFPDE